MGRFRLGLAGCRVVGLQYKFFRGGLDLLFSGEFSIALLCFSHAIRRYGLFVQSLGFTVTSILGITRVDMPALLALLAG